MSVFRVEKSKNYTVMSNTHLKDRRLSFKAKGLLSMMLSLPEDWDYTLGGLATLSTDGKDSVRQGIRELEEAGYIRRHRIRDEQGRLRGSEYIIYEEPQTAEEESAGDTGSNIPKASNPKPESKSSAMPFSSASPAPQKPTFLPPALENPIEESSMLENATTNKILTESNTYPLSTKISNPNPSIMGNTVYSETDGYEGMGYEEAKNQVIENISYDQLTQEFPDRGAELDEVVELMTEMLCANQGRMRVAGADYPAKIVRDRVLTLRKDHIAYVMDSFHENSTNVRNIKKYLQTALFNAPVTMNHYYTARVQYDMYGNQPRMRQ